MRAKQMFRLYWKRVGVVGVAAAGLGLHQHQWEHKDVDKVGRESILDKNIVNLAPSAGQRVNEMTTTGTPGVTVAVTVDGRLVHEAGYGLADVENARPCRPDTVMRIASISKAVTATIAARLVDEGKLDLDASVYDLLPTFPRKQFEGKPVDISVRQLLSHRGGIRHYHHLSPQLNRDKNFEDALYASYGAREPRQEYLMRRVFRSTTDALELFEHDELAARPGVFNYSTHGFALLAACLEQVSGGRDFPRLTRDLFERLGMLGSRVDRNEPIVPNRARFYRRDAQHRLVNVPEVDVSYKLAGGGLLSTAADLTRLGNAVLASYQGCANSLLKLATAQTFWTPQGEQLDKSGDFYVLGWSHRPRLPAGAGLPGNSTGFWYHTGAATGASSVLWVKPAPRQDPDRPRGVCVAVLANCMDVYGDITELAASIGAQFVDY